MSGTWLVLDIGNTHTVAGIFSAPTSALSTMSAKKPIAGIRFRTDAGATADEYRSRLFELFEGQARVEKWRGKKDPISLISLPERVIVSTVVPSLEPVLKEAFGEIPCHLISHEDHRKFELKIPFPAQLGADRLANVAGALTLVQPPFLIVDAGTATTFCLVDPDRNYLGGAITPGLEISWKTLQSRAAKLYSVELHRPENVIGNTTETQIQSGVILGYESLIEGMTDRILAQAPFSNKQVTLLATGGITQVLKLSPRFRMEPDLTLLGLLQYGQWNPK